jgi:hypothetical protein
MFAVDSVLPSMTPARAKGGGGLGGWLVGATVDGAESASIGTCKIALHCGHDARLPPADAATFSSRPQLVQGNSIWPATAGGVPNDIV